MTESVKAVLLSALVFPGAGHLYLKRYVMGFLVVVTATGALLFLMIAMAHNLLPIVEKIQSGEIPANWLTVTTLVSKQFSDPDTQQPINALTVFFVVWLAAIIDCHRAGRT